MGETTTERDDVLAEDLEQVAQTEQVEDEAEWVSEGYEMMLGAPQNLRLVLSEYIQGADPASFIEIKGTGLKEDDIVAEAGQYVVEGEGGGNRAARRHQGKRGKGGQAPTVTAKISPNRAFVGKCRVQIVGYRLRAKDQRTNEVIIRTFSDKPDANDEIYVSWLQPGNERIRDLVEGAMDKMAGRDTPAQADFEALKNAQ